MNDTQISAGIDLLFTGIFFILPIVLYTILNRTVKNELKATIAKKAPTPLKIIGGYIRTGSVNPYIWIMLITLIPILIYLLMSDQVKEAFAVYKQIEQPES